VAAGVTPIATINSTKVRLALECIRIILRNVALELAHPLLFNCFLPVDGTWPEAANGLV
jgi:hypothetical protein